MKKRINVRYDYALCANGEFCNKKLECKRYLGEKNSYQTYSFFYIEGKECIYFEEA